MSVEMEQRITKRKSEWRRGNRHGQEQSWMVLLLPAWWRT